MRVLVKDNNTDQALRVLKKKMQRERIYQELKKRRHFVKPSEERVLREEEVSRRIRRNLRKRFEREGF